MIFEELFSEDIIRAELALYVEYNELGLVAAGN
jgi:hypothetical protein